MKWNDGFEDAALPVDVHTIAGAGVDDPCPLPVWQRYPVIEGLLADAHAGEQFIAECCQLAEQLQEASWPDRGQVEELRWAIARAIGVLEDFGAAVADQHSQRSGLTS